MLEGPECGIMRIYVRSTSPWINSYARAWFLTTWRSTRCLSVQRQPGVWNYTNTGKIYITNPRNQFLCKPLPFREYGVLRVACLWHWLYALETGGPGVWTYTNFCTIYLPSVSISLLAPDFQRLWCSTHCLSVTLTIDSKDWRPLVWNYTNFCTIYLPTVSISRLAPDLFRREGLRVACLWNWLNL